VALTAALDVDRAMTTVTYSGASNPTATIVRVDSTGKLVPVRNADPATLVAGGWVGSDFEPPLDEPFRYVATDDTTGVVQESPEYVLSSGGRTWIKHPGRPDLNVAVEVAEIPELVRAADVGVFHVLGRSVPVAVAAARKAPTGTAAFNTITRDDADAFARILADGSPLLLSTPYGYGFGNRYVVFHDVTESRRTRVGATPDRRWAVAFSEVDVPIGAGAAVGNAWTDVLGAYGNWLELANAHPSWGDVLAGVD
jgi:hypothetical protein